MPKLLELSGFFEEDFKMARKKATRKKPAKKVTKRKPTKKKVTRRKATKKTTKRKPVRKTRGMFGSGMEDGICMSLKGDWVFSGLTSSKNASVFFKDLMKTARRLKREGKIMGAWLWGQRARTVARRYGLKAEERTADRFIDTLFA